MDIQLKKKPWFVRHKYYVLGGIVFLSLAAYTVALLFSPEKQRVSADTLGLADFLEYVEQEGVVQPMLSLRVNSRISGYVERIVAEEGARVRQGDTLLVLSNPELLDEMEVQENALHKQLMSYREQEIEMEQKTLAQTGVAEPL
jgi:multidrug efflux pump subunit AcrA (membrane-fusion protein)